MSKVRGKRRRARRNGRSRMGMSVITFVVLLLLAVFLIEGISLRQRFIANDEEKQSLMSAPAEEDERSTRADEYREYLKSEEYIKQVAHEKLGLVEADEIIFKERN